MPTLNLGSGRKRPVAGDRRNGRKAAAIDTLPKGALQPGQAAAVPKGGRGSAMRRLGAIKLDPAAIRALTPGKSSSDQAVLMQTFRDVLADLATAATLIKEILEDDTRSQQQ
jgi:hypothetical protein